MSAGVRLTFYEKMIEQEKFLLSALTMSVLSGLNIEKMEGFRKAQKKRSVIMRFLCKAQRKLSVITRCPYYTVSINEVRPYLKMVRWRCPDDELQVLMEFSRDEHSFGKIRCTKKNVS